MTQDEIMEMAQECKLIGSAPHLDGIYMDALLSFAQLVAAKEREAQRTWVRLTDEALYKAIEAKLKETSMTKDEICGLLRQIHDVLAMQSETNQVKPVAWMDRDGDIYKELPNEYWNPPHTPIYAKREWVGLTDEEITELRLKTFDTWATNYEVYKFIETKLKEKNNV